MKTTNKGGRPASYTPEQLDSAIVVAEQRWPEVTWGHVKAVLVEDFRISATIRDESLEKAVEPILAQRQRIREDEMIARLPEATRAVIAEAAADMERRMALTCARGEARGETDRAAKSEEESRQRLELIRRIVELEAERDQAIAELQAANAQLAVKAALIKTRDRQLAKVEKRNVRLEGMIEGMKSSAPSPQTARNELRPSHKDPNLQDEEIVAADTKGRLADLVA